MSFTSVERTWHPTVATARNDCSDIELKRTQTADAPLQQAPVAGTMEVDDSTDDATVSPSPSATQTLYLMKFLERMKRTWTLKRTCVQQHDKQCKELCDGLVETASDGGRSCSVDRVDADQNVNVDMEPASREARTTIKTYKSPRFARETCARG